MCVDLNAETVFAIFRIAEREVTTNPRLPHMGI